MKKLLDEGPDDFTRALLEAGAQQRPPTGSRARLLVALGVGTSFGLLSAKALAWCGTQAGKWTLFGVALCSAGTIYAVLPAPSAEPTATPTAVVGDRPPADAPRDGLVDTPVDGIAKAPRDNRAPRAKASTPRAVSSSGVTRPAVDDGLSPSSPKPRRKSSPPATTERMVREGAAEVSGTPADLEVEVRLLDQLRSATLRRDWEQAQELVDRYRHAFPRGQLEQDVSALAAQVSVRSRR